MLGRQGRALWLHANSLFFQALGCRGACSAAAASLTPPPHHHHHPSPHHHHPLIIITPQEIDELFKIFMVMGTPDEHCWPGVRELPDWKETFPKWRPRPLSEVAPTLDPLGLDLLSRMLVYDPAQRVTAREALTHPYFADLQALLQAHPRVG